MNPFTIEDEEEEEEDEDERTQQSAEEEVEVELYANRKVDGGSAKQSRSSYDMRPVTAGVATMEMEKSPLRHADDSNDRTPQNRSCLVKCLERVGGCLCLPCSTLRRWMILYREVPHEKIGDEALQRM